MTDRLWTVFLALPGETSVVEEIDVTAETRWDARKVARTMLQQDYEAGLHIVGIIPIEENGSPIIRGGFVA